MVSAPLVGLVEHTTELQSHSSVVWRRWPAQNTGTSLVPLMVTVTSWLLVPSEDTAVKLSVSDCPAPRCSIPFPYTTLFRSQLPLAASVKLPKPLLPAVLACAVKLDWP